MGDEGEVDKRVDWVAARIRAAYAHLKPGAFDKLFPVEDNMRILGDFLDSEDRTAMYFVSDKVTASFALPQGLSNNTRVVCVMKGEPLSVSEKDVDTTLTVFDMDKEPLSVLQASLEELFVPLLSNDGNQKMWGEVATREVMNKVHNFVSDITITNGRIEGKTTLPIPMGLPAGPPVGEGKEEVKVKESTKDQMHQIETAVVTWTRQIRAVLKRDPDHAFRGGAQPTPLVEVRFWKGKAADVNAIFDQLELPRARRVLDILNKQKHTYSGPFARLCKELFAAREEANDNVRFLKVLEPWLGKLQDASDLKELEMGFRPMMHVLLLIWRHSQYYNTPVRLVVLVRQMSNSIIRQGRTHLSSEDLFKFVETEEPATGAAELRKIISTCSAFKAAFFEYKARAATECPENEWRIQNSALFSRLDAFMERCHDLLHFMETTVQYAKLETLEVGGTKGKALTTSVRQVHTEYVKEVQAITSLGFDVMDVANSDFDTAYLAYRMRVKELDRRMAALLVQAFEDASTLGARFKLMTSFELMLQRATVAEELEKRHGVLVGQYTDELRTVQDYFLRERDHPPVASNLPPVAGALTWCHSLKERVDLPMERLRNMGPTIMEREEAKDVVRLYTNLIKSLQDYEHEEIATWAGTVQESSEDKLKLPLLRREEDGTVSVNFDPALVCLLREIKYFLLLGLDVPEEALSIFQRSEIYRRQTGKLELIVNRYNSMLRNMLPVERPLVQKHFDTIDRTMEKGIKVILWKSSGIDDFIDLCMQATQAAYTIVSALKTNMRAVEDQLAEWRKCMATRSAKPLKVKEFEAQFKASRTQRLDEIKKTSRSLLDALKGSNKALKVSAGHPDWRAYVDFANNVVVEGLASVVAVTYEFFLKQVDPAEIAAAEAQPLLEVDLTLSKDSVAFNPPVQADAAGARAGAATITQLLNSWLGSVLEVGNRFKRLDTGEGNFVKELQNHMYLCALIGAINEHVEAHSEELMALQRDFEKYSHLWDTDMDEHFATFLEERGMRTTETGQRMVDREVFDAEITRYREIQREIRKIKSPVDLGWVRVNTQPIRQSLDTWSSRWLYKYTQYLHDHVVGQLEDVTLFSEEVKEGLTQPVEEGNKDALMQVMTHIRDVRRRSEEDTSGLFDELRETVMLLKKHGTAVDDVRVKGRPALEVLEDVPVQWDATVKAMFDKKEEIIDLRAAEAESTKGLVEEFFLRMRAFRNEFRAKAPFAFTGPPDEAYSQLTDYNAQVNKLAAESVELNALEELFELPVSRYQEVADTKSDLRLLKRLWDSKAMIGYIFADWQSLLWAKIDTDALTEQTNKLQKKMRDMGTANQNIKGWQVFKDINQDVKDMATVLSVVNDLHSDAMRDRHWISVAKVCSVPPINPHNPRFALEDLLELKLHEHVDDVLDVVEKATKELKIEKKLSAIAAAWKDLELEYVPHNDDVFTVKVPDEVVEFLEAHQLELQSIVGMGRFVDFFRDEVTKWQEDLGTVESVLKMWMAVTKQWASLESIFLGSADISSQLPDDTQRFKAIDADFKELMKKAVETPNVIDACTAEGREELLKTSLIPGLERCQKSLNEYLDVKKKIFPRFYFVSNVALLDMLSNGNNAPRIMHHVGDCYDGLSKLTFVEGSTKETDSMIAKDREVVPFFENFIIEGEVENWLNSLTAHMQKTLATVMDRAMETAVTWDAANEKPRDQWLFDYPAQIVLTACLAYWTEESEAALEELENGVEDAVKRYGEVCTTRLQALIKLVQGKLVTADRTKIIALITMDVHGRDVVQRLVDTKAEGPLSFQWQQQLRFYKRPDNPSIDLRITDFATKYTYEYIGNTGRLVITPLTDRCYITLTMAMRLMLGGAPAGPAGTGKTETTKDLARALALPCYVFNCSDQMNYQTLADIFKGLAQAGAWGCFDEFNRIPIEVLSVVATQVKSVLDAIVRLAVPANRPPEYQDAPAGRPPQQVGLFELQGDTVSLVPTVGFFITMNPGYAGRTELPENVKALFRSCAMIRPDLEPICENMLMAEGFIDARPLAVKFVTLYQLSSELLSPQVHYDWGLRSVKAVLRVAGALKRGEPDLMEEAVLMRALRDFNTPKMPLMDVPIFLRLIEDLFPSTHGTPPMIDETIKGKTIKYCKSVGLQHDDGFVAKVVQFQELLDVRHSVMILGPAGCGKTTVWKALLGAQNVGFDKPIGISRVVNPKAVTTNELYGYMTLSKDWKDGVISIIMRGMSKNFRELGFTEAQTIKWVVLDGDIDAVWIESMNTVMDDNKVLTLVSNERVPLSDAMRMVFEINSLANAMPSTVSRAGILYINESDVGWGALTESWLAGRESENERSFLPNLFEAFIEPIREFTRKEFKQITPLRIINQVTTVCYLLEGLLDKVPDEERTQEVLEGLFGFACVWAFGGIMAVDKSGDHRKNFHNAWVSTFSQFKYPSEDKEDTCFDYFFDPATKEWVHWATRVPEYTHIPIGTDPGHVSFSSIVVPTSDTLRMQYLVELLAARGRAAMLVGLAGTGKSMVLNDFMSRLDDDMLSTNIGMNYYMDARSLQLTMEGVIDKRSGTTFGPPAGKHMLYFVDDINLPYIEEYGTQNSLELLRQVIDHGFAYDREDASMKKDIVDVQFIAAMNPTSGSFSINERIQRHFATFAAIMPNEADLTRIYTSILDGHFESFEDGPRAAVAQLVACTIRLHNAVATKFLPSAIRFVYNWNMRELNNVFQGVTRATPDAFGETFSVVRLLMHECQRVYGDRLINESDAGIFTGFVRDAFKRDFPEINQEELHEEPLVFTTFAISTGGGKYLPMASGEEGTAKLKEVLENKLAEYNEVNAIMDLVLFEQAIQHVCRICRIIGNPAGNAMLIGVGGSGKQSLSRLASFICGYTVQQLSVTSKFTVEDLKENLLNFYKMAGAKGTPVTFLMTDAQIVNDEFLVYINDILSTGWIPDLIPKEEIDGILGGLRNEAKAAGVSEAPDEMLEFFKERVRRNLHVVLCFSPVGDSFRIRARRFPGIINCTAIDFFHAWPEEALVSVALRFLDGVELETDELRENMSQHMAMVHTSVTDASQRFLQAERRYNYVTPKSFLELIDFYKYLLGEKRQNVDKLIDRLDVGLSTLRKTAEDVAELQIDLNHTMEKVEEKRAASEVLLEQMAVQRAEAEREQAKASIEEEKAATASASAAKIEAEAETELAEAKPAMDAAAEAVDCLDKASLTELKNFSKPPSGVDLVTAGCLMMLEGEFKNHAWDRAKKMMAKVDAFLDSLKSYDARNMTENLIEKLTPIVENPMMTHDIMIKKSSAAANLCAWVQNIYKYNRIYVRVKPLMDSLEEARDNKASAQADLQVVREKVAALNAKLAELEDTFKNAMEEKQKVEEEAAACLERLGLAERLVNGLSSENKRWGQEIEALRDGRVRLIGDVLLAAAFTSYVGGFNSKFRKELWSERWTPDLVQRAIPLTEGVDPLGQLASEGDIAKMNGEGLPEDRVSSENGAIILTCKRWPLCIDPQLQGIKWLRDKEKDNNLKVIQVTMKNWVNALQNAVTTGTSLIIENLSEELDATLDPILARAIYRKGRGMYLNLGGEEIEYDKGFRLFLQTKLSNPHYKPEVQAQCTMINFIATEQGLEEQLLARVVNAEKPELEASKQELQRQFNEYKIQLIELENQLLERLANAPDDILSDVPLIEGLEATKKTSIQINEAVTKGRETEKQINVSREVFRPVAQEGAMLYFILTQLYLIEHMYQYSLDAYVAFFYKAIRTCEVNDDVKARVELLRKHLRLTIFTWVSRGLFVRHKLILLGQITFQLMQRNVLEDVEFEQPEMEYLMRGPKKLDEDNAVEWLPNSAWFSAQALAELEGFERFPADIVEAAPRFREWFNHVTPESEKLPLTWAGLDKTPFKKLLVLRALRPDRLEVALAQFIRVALPDGDAFVDCDARLNSFQVLADVLGDSNPGTPIFFILSPGADVVSDVDRLAKEKGMEAGISYHNVSMGQGMDKVAMEKLELAHQEGHWVILNNVHLMPRWLVELEKRLDDFAREGSHDNFRIYLTGEPANDIPIGILNRSIKLTNEPPSGLRANLVRAFCLFSPEQIDEADSKMKAILFGLCHFHAIMIERKKFGPKGFNMIYPFSLGDLRDSSICLSNYMENASAKIPWEDLRYIFGQIMYGGHIVNDFDRLLCMTYLEFYMKDGLLDETELFPFAEEERVSFKSPAPTTYSSYLEHINENLPPETPVAFGLHPNAEIDYRTTQSVSLLNTLLELQPRDGGAGEGALSPQHVAEQVLDDILDRYNDSKFDVEDIDRELDEKGPFQNVFLQECEQMEVLLEEIKRSLAELKLGFKGELTMSDAMEALMEDLFLNRVPDSWAKKAWPSQRPLTGWLINMTARIEQLQGWVDNPLEIPRCTWLSGLINPQSFLTAISQQTAQAQGLELDKLFIQTDVTKHQTPDKLDAHSREGAFVHGLFLEGARWDSGGFVDSARPREMFFPMPVINCKAASVAKADVAGQFQCPCYKTEQRGPTYVFLAQLKTKSSPARWVLAGAALIMDMVQ